MQRRTRPASTPMMTLMMLVSTPRPRKPPPPPPPSGGGASAGGENSETSAPCTPTSKVRFLDARPTFPALSAPRAQKTYLPGSSCEYTWGEKHSRHPSASSSGGGGSALAPAPAASSAAGGRLRSRHAWEETPEPYDPSWEAKEKAGRKRSSPLAPSALVFFTFTSAGRAVSGAVVSTYSTAGGREALFPWLSAARSSSTYRPSPTAPSAHSMGELHAPQVMYGSSSSYLPHSASRAVMRQSTLCTPEPPSPSSALNTSPSAREASSTWIDSTGGERSTCTHSARPGPTFPTASVARAVKT
mmetsp:Transcript_31842/g.101439  ORF Transcript_31842/g.101439 Transcript_31842/m.101439 type:complete len:301 (+) Transcript_31842:765-1667(+)